MLRKMFSLGALVVVAVTFGVGNAAAKPNSKPRATHGQFAGWVQHGRFVQGGTQRRILGRPHVL